ncbi:MAG: prolyl oligopeptidase family serine peptidase, partial [Ignavibacteria bacterium]|nr:prolyl oligopeptidase family serine peptidase [Ignavibacteria bacterium]
MKAIRISFILIVVFSSLNVAQQKIIYPQTKKVNVVDKYFGKEISDPYRWLEDDNSPEVKNWIEEQNKITFDYLSKIPYRGKIKQRITELMNYPRYSAPFKAGSKYFFYKNDGLQNQSVLYIQDDLKSEPRVFLDPNKFSDDGTISLSGLSASNDGKYVAYSIAKSGSDWNEAFVMEVESQRKLVDHIKWIKFSGMSWYKDGFFYSRYDEPVKGTELTASNEYHKVYYHKIGTNQNQDSLIYEDKAKPKRNFYAYTTDDETFLILGMSEGSSGKNAFYVKNLKTNSDFIKVVDNFENQYSVIENIGEKLLVITDKNAPNLKLVLIDPLSPQEKNWKEIIPEKKQVMQFATVLGGKIIVSYLKDASSHCYIYSLDGKYEQEIKLPSIGTVGGFAGKKEDEETFYTFTSFTYPPVIYQFNLKTKQSKLFRKTEIKFNFSDYITKQVFYKSKDGTKIPMFIVHKKGIKLNGKNPTLLYAYGGFKASMTPSFSATRLLLLENGGVYAMANLRGGGEYGEEWHKAGMLLNKQNVFDDFISAAEYLIKNKYTSPNKLAIQGGSNGGLLIGAVINQRPELFKVALPAVGVMDMLRYHKFTIGWSWVAEYGSSDDSIHFNNLLKYSPLHNISDKLNYPATLVTTADHDDRVVPA